MTGIINNMFRPQKKKKKKKNKKNKKKKKKKKKEKKRKKIIHYTSLPGLLYGSENWTIKTRTAKKK